MRGLTDLKPDLYTQSKQTFSRSMQPSKFSRLTKLPGTQSQKQFRLEADKIGFKFSKSPHEMTTIHRNQLLQSFNEIKEMKELHFDREKPKN